MSTSAKTQIEQRYQTLYTQYKQLKSEYNKLKQAYSQTLDRYHSECKLRISQSEQIQRLNSQIKDLREQLEYSVHHDLTADTLQAYARTLCAQNSSKILSIKFFSPKRPYMGCEDESPRFFDDFSQGGRIPQVVPDESIEVESDESRLLEAFLIVGLPPDQLTQNQQPQILFEFQGEALTQSARKILVDFCFPYGINVNSASPSDIIHKDLTGKSYIFTLKSQNEAPSQSIASSLPNSDKQVLYFVCLKLDQLITRAGSVWIAERVFCAVSYLPLFEAHFEVLRAVAEGSSEPLSILQECKSYDWVSPGRVIELGSFRYQLPEDMSSIDIVWLCAPLLSSLMMKDVVKLVCALMQEKSVIFLSHNLGLISSCVLGTVALLRPFKWPNITIPIIPSSLKELLEAPVPIVAGYNGSVQRKHSQHIVFVDLDEPNPYYRVQASLANQLTELHDAELNDKLSRLSAVFKQDKVVFRPSQEEREVCLEVAAALRSYWWKIIRLIPENFIDDFGSLSRYLKTKLPPSDYKFIDNVLQTQMFSNLIDELF